MTSVTHQLGWLKISQFSGVFAGLEKGYYEDEGIDLLAHANYFETSCMLHVNPDLIRMDRATSKQDFDSLWDYRTDQVSASGVWGRDIPQANAENGEREITRCIETMARAVAAAINEPFPHPE